MSNNIYCPKGSFLIHYASPYYDPVKAHEYYMEHRKLKGRNFNSTGSEASSYVKAQLDAERDNLIEKHRQKTDQNISNIKTSSDNEIKSISERAKSDKKRLSDETKSKIKQSSNETKGKITSLREKLKNMSKTQRLIKRDSIQAEIDRLREENSETRSKLQEELGYAKENISETARANNQSIRTSRTEGVKNERDTHTAYKKDVKEEYDRKYQEELDKMEQDSSFVNKKKRRR